MFEIFLKHTNYMASSPHWFLYFRSKVDQKGLCHALKNIK